MVLFLISEELKYGEHVRHLKGRAQRLAEEAAGMPESRAGARKTLLADEAQAMNLARALCDDNDHELVYDQACGLHERGEFEAARGLYELADRICGGIDAKVQNNLREVMAALDVDGIAKAANALNEVAAEAAEMASSSTEDCQSGVDVACDTLSLEDEAKKQWLKSMDVDGVQAAATELNNIVDKLASAPSDEAAKQEWLKQLDTPASTWGAAAKGVSAVVSEANKMVELTDECDAGYDDACEALSMEAQAKKEWLARNMDFALPPYVETMPMPQQPQTEHAWPSPSMLRAAPPAPRGVTTMQAFGPPEGQQGPPPDQQGQQQPFGQPPPAGPAALWSGPTARAGRGATAAIWSRPAAQPGAAGAAAAIRPGSPAGPADAADA